MRDIGVGAVGAVGVGAVTAVGVGAVSAICVGVGAVDTIGVGALNAIALDQWVPLIVRAAGGVGVGAMSCRRCWSNERHR